MGTGLEEVSRPVRVALIGLGQLTREVHLPNLLSLPAVRVTAVVDPDAGACERAGAPIAGARRLASVEELDAGIADVVLIASPTAEHARHGQIVAERGLPFYLEKPLASTLGDAESLMAVVARTGVHATMGFNYRFHPGIDRLRVTGAKTIQSTFTIARRELPVWKRARDSGGGVLLDLASHHFDLLRYVLNSEVENVEAKIWSEVTEDDCAEVQLQFRNGVRASCLFSFCRDESDHMAVTTESGPVLRHTRYGSGAFPWWPPHRLVALLAEQRRSPWREVSFRRSLVAWLDSVRSGGAPPVTLQDGLESLRIVLAAEQAAKHV